MTEQRTRRAARQRTDEARRLAPLMRSRRRSVNICVAIVLAFYFIGLMWFLRPSFSEVEKRNLTEFPEVTAERLVSGAFFSDAALWYSDTYPVREQLVGASQALSQMRGIQTGERMVGGGVAADELPPVDGDAPETPAQEGEGAAETEPAAPETAWKDEGPVEVPTAEEMQADIQAQIMSGLYVNNGAAYSVYYFIQSAVEQYAAAMNACADALDGEAKVYSMLVPNNSGAILDDDVLAALGGTDQRDALRYSYSLMNDKVGKVFILDVLREHRDEYIYFRSDHHWTQLGAYWAYTELCRVRGVEPQPVLSWEKMSFEPFLGTFYAELGDAQMAANPDRVDAYIPSGTNDMVYWDTEGTRFDWYVVADVSDWANNSFYMCYIAGDRPLSIIENPAREDKPVALVIKDSYGNAFVPCLVDDYSKVYVIDYRYSDVSIPQFVRENGVDEVIFANNMTLAGTESVASKLWSMCQG